MPFRHNYNLKLLIRRYFQPFRTMEGATLWPRGLGLRSPTVRLALSVFALLTVRLALSVFALLTVRLALSYRLYLRMPLT